MTPDDRKRSIGKVISICADKFIIELHRGTDSFTLVGFDDIHYVACLGSFLMIPTNTEYVVVEIIGLWEKDSSSIRGDERNLTLDKSASAKFLDVVPVGMLPQDKKDRFRFGVSTYPSLYADVLYTLDNELDRIFDVENSEIPSNGISSAPYLKETCYRAITVGTSAIFQGYEVKIRLEDFFGGHAAILGNTGSGKSCTVSSILQSIFEKENEHKARGATFVIFDVNGEYNDAFSELNKKEINVTELLLDGSSDKGKFRLPHWFLDQSEWELLLQASERSQTPVLRNALGLTSMLSRAFGDENLKSHFVAKCILECLSGADGDSPVSKIQRISSLLNKYPTSKLGIGVLSSYGCNATYGNFSPPTRLNEFVEHLKTFILENVSLPSYSGQAFNFNDLKECLDFAILYEEAHGNRQIRDYCSSMMTRFYSLSDRNEFNFLKSEVDDAYSEEEFLKQILGVRDPSGSEQNQIIILNMNSVDDEIVEIVSSVVARLVFKRLRQASTRNQFPVHFILEEAHRYISEKPSRYAVEASKIFERIAKEGRKYGVFLLVASQRPSELSRTVLSQCSNFVVHRIQNPEDLSHIRQMTPFISDSVLKRLPSLPKQHALVFGNAVNLPTTFKVRNAVPRPHSHDTEICNLWFKSSQEEKLLPLINAISSANESPPPI